MTSLAAVLGSLVEQDGGYRIEAPEAWAQGRTLYGGINAALTYAALVRAHGTQPPIRSVQLAFVGPAAGALDFRSEVLRQGKSSASFATECRNAEGVAARGTFVFGAGRESAVAHDFAPRFELPAPEDSARFHKTDKPLPGFLGRFEFRLASGARLFEPEKKPEFAVWARLVEGDSDDPVANLLAIADALPCAAMANFPRPAAVSTVTWGIDFHQPAPAASGWHLIRSVSEQAAEGYSLQEMRLFNRAGEALASARQLVAIFA